MGVAHGFGMLALGMIAIAIGGTIALYIINNYVNIDQHKEDNE
jgi:4-amino-4-deoxy-L-arabinose transferase-like glycosyltransferase